MLFAEPIWLSLVAPTLFALVLLIASLAARYFRHAGLSQSALLSAAGLALAIVAGGAVLAALLVGFVLFTHWIAIAIEQPTRGRPRDARSDWRPRVYFVAAVGAYLAMAAGMSLRGLAAAPQEDLAGMLVPFGASFFAFHGISYVADVYHRRAAAEHSRSQLAVHLVLLPQIVSGPLAYEGAPRLLARTPNVSDYSYGLRRLSIGVWKVFVMAYVARVQADRVFALRPERLNAWQAWLGLVAFTLQMYYAFSGFSDMGIGVARMLAIRLPENFRWPYVAESVRDFWRRWHIGLSAWFRDYADVSLVVDRVPPPTLGREVLVVLLCGVWYGVGWTFVVWGVYHAALITLEWLGVERAVKRLPAALRHVYLVAVVMAGWVILRSSSLASAAMFFTSLAGLNASASPVRPAIGGEVWLVLAAGVIGCAPLLSTIRRWTVVIDALIASLLMMLFAAIAFAWRSSGNIAALILRWWRVSLGRAGR